jgi:hypothetical protein
VVVRRGLPVRQTEALVDAVLTKRDPVSVVRAPATGSTLASPGRTISTERTRR